MLPSSLCIKGVPRGCGPSRVKEVLASYPGSFYVFATFWKQRTVADCPSNTSWTGGQHAPYMWGNLTFHEVRRNAVTFFAIKLHSQQLFRTFITAAHCGIWMVSNLEIVSIGIYLYVEQIGYA